MAVPLPSGGYALAVSLAEPIVQLYAFMVETESELLPKFEAVNPPVAFAVALWVDGMGPWTVLRSGMDVRPWPRLEWARRDPFTGVIRRRWHDLESGTFGEEEVDLRAALGLEPDCLWGPSHAAQRLEDLMLDRPNEMYERMALGPE